MKKLLLSAFLLLWNYGFSQEKILFVDIEKLKEEAVASGRNGNFEETLRILEKVNKNDSTYCGILISKSYYLLQLEKYEEAIVVVEDGLNRDCADSKFSYLINKGVALENLGKLEDANAHYEEALKAFPRNAQLWNNKGVVLEKLERIEEAIEAYQRAIFYQPGYKKPHLRLGNISYRQEKMAQAVMCFNTYLFLEPDADDAFNILSSLNNLVITKNPNTANPAISISADEDSFETIDLILENKLALNENYLINTKINVPVIRQNHALLDQLKNYEGTEGFWSQTYVPLYKWIIENGHFNDFAHTLAFSIENEEYKKVVEKNIAGVRSFSEAFNLKWREILSQSTFHPGDEENGMAYSYLDSYVEAIGKMEAGKTLGNWKFYNEDGSYGGKGGFNNEGARQGEWVWYYPNGKIKEVANYKNGILQGENRGFYESGRLKYETSLANDELEGEYRYYNEKGALLQKKHFTAGELDGIYEAYFAVGEELPEFYIPYKKGKAEDKFFEYYANGDVYMEKFFKNGKLHGVEKQYNFNKSLFSEILYENGLPVGVYKTFYPNGQVKESGQYKNGLYEGAFKTFYMDGTLQSELTYNKGELENLYRYYDTDGKLFYEYNYKKGKLTGYVFYNKNGEVLEKGSKKGGEFYYKGYSPQGNLITEGLYDVSGGKTGPWKFYTGNGILEFWGEYLAGNIVGEYREYFLNGKVKTLSTYNNGELNGYYVENYPNGKIKSQGWFKGGLRVGEWRDYYIDGQLNSLNYYHKGNLHGEQEYYGPAGSLSHITTFNFGDAVTDRFYAKDRKLFETIDYKAEENKYILSNKHFNGNINSTTSYLNGVKHGLYEYFDFEGNKRLSGNYLNGSEHGKWTWYYPNGKEERVANYVEGKVHGELKDYYDTGVPEDLFLFEFGKATGKAFSYHENGEVETATEYYEDEQHGRKEFYSPSGKLQLVRFYDHGRLTGYSYLGTDGKEVPVIELPNETGVITAFYDNGNISRQMEYRNGVLVGTNKAFYYSGQLENEILNDNGNYNGSFTEFYADGKKKTEKEYIQDHLQGKVKIYHENGKLKEETNYVNNRREGDSFHYDSTGKLIKKEEYLNDEVFSSEVL